MANQPRDGNGQQSDSDTLAETSAQRSCLRVSMLCQKTNQRKMPAYVGAVFVYQGARLPGGFGVALVMYEGSSAEREALLIVCPLHSLKLSSVSLDCKARWLSVCSSFMP